MKKILLVAALLIVCGSVAAQAMGDLYVSGTWRYKMTVVVETPEGTKTGSAVHELSNADSDVKIIDLPAAVNPPDFRGEAVAVDLGKKGIVFATLPTDPYYMFQNSFYGNGSGAFTIKGIKFFNSLPKGLKKELSLKDYPRFVMFKNLNDPKSVALVRGAEFDAGKQKYLPVDNFERFFGSGVKLKNITLQITDERVTWGIEELLPWLQENKGHYIHGGMSSREAPLGLHGGNFKREK